MLCVSPCGSACLPVSIKAASVCVCAAAERQNRLMQSIGRSGWVWAPVCSCNRPLCLRCMRAAIRRSFLNCVADSRRLLCARRRALLGLAQRAFSKRFPSPRQTEWYPCHLSLPMSEAQPGSGVIWCRHAPRASRPHRVTPHRAWLWPGSRSGLGGCSSSQVL